MSRRNTKVDKWLEGIKTRVDMAAEAVRLTEETLARRKYEFDMLNRIYEQALIDLGPASKPKQAPPQAETKKRTRKSRQLQPALASPNLAGGDLDSPETCIRCPNPIDDNIHHKATAEGYHEFKSAA